MEDDDTFVFPCHFEAGNRPTLFVGAGIAARGKDNTDCGGKRPGSLIAPQPTLAQRLAQHPEIAGQPREDHLSLRISHPYVELQNLGAR